MDLSKAEQLLYTGLSKTEIIKVKLRAVHAGVEPKAIMKAEGKIAADNLGLQAVQADTVQQERELIRLIYGI